MDDKALRLECLKLAIQLKDDITWDCEDNELLSMADTFLSYVNNLPEHSLTTLTTSDGSKVQAHISIIK